MEKFKEKPLLIPKHNKGSGEEGILLLYNGPLYYLVRELMKKENPEAYNALLIAVAKSQNPHSEVVMYTDANGTLRNASNTGAGFVSGTDPVGAEVVAGAVLGKPLELAGRAAMYGLGRAGNKWARAKLISREMQNVATPNRTYPLHVGLGLPKTTTNYFKDAYGREITPTPYPGTDAELLSYMDEAHTNVLKDYFSPEKINLLKSTLGWGDLEIKEFQDELIRTIGYKNNIKTQVKGPEDGFVLIGSHRGGIEGSGNTALGVHSITLNRERIPSAQIALEAVIHELGAHGKTASMKATDFGAGGFTDKMREAFPRMAELVLKNEELANDLLVLNRRGLFFNLFKNIGDLERYFINNNLSWKDKWSKFNDRFNYFKYTTSPQEKMARAYTGQLYNKVYDPTTKTLNIELLENFYTPESVEAFKKAVLGIAPIATISGVVPSDKKGSKILIKKKNRGKFTEYCGGEVTNECILKAKKSKNPTLRKRATFALNARGWAKKHADGGDIAIEGAKTIGGYLPFIGTAIDAYELYKNPSWRQAGWTALGLLTDVFTGGSARAVVKTARNLKKAKEALSIVRGPMTKRLYKDSATDAIKANTKAKKDVLRDASFNIGQNYVQYITDKYVKNDNNK